MIPLSRRRRGGRLPVLPHVVHLGELVALIKGQMEADERRRRFLKWGEFESAGRSAREESANGEDQVI